MVVTDLASVWDEASVAHDPSRSLILDALRLASLLASTETRRRYVWCLLLHSDVLTCIASSETAGAPAHGPFRVSEHAEFDRALTAGEIVTDVSQAVLPVRGDGGILGVLVIDGEGGLDDRLRATMATIAGIVGLALTQASAVTELQLEAERSRRLERLEASSSTLRPTSCAAPSGSSGAMPRRSPMECSPIWIASWR